MLVPSSGFSYHNAVQGCLSKMAPFFDIAVWDDNLKAFNSTGSSPLVFDFGKYKS